MIYQFTKIETAFDVESSMGRKVPYVKEILEASETELGSIYSYDVMIDLPEDGAAKSRKTLVALDSLQRYHGALIDVLDHGFAADIRQNLAGQAGGGVTGGDDAQDFFVHHEHLSFERNSGPIKPTISPFPISRETSDRE